MKLEFVPFKRHGLIYNCYVLLNAGQINKAECGKGRQKVDLNRIRIIRKQILMNLMPCKVFSVAL